jgi:hypothetical protein
VEELAQQNSDCDCACVVGGRGLSEIAGAKEPPEHALLRTFVVLLGVVHEIYIVSANCKCLFHATDGLEAYPSVANWSGAGGVGSGGVAEYADERQPSSGFRLPDPLAVATRRLASGGLRELSHLADYSTGIRPHHSVAIW